MGLTRYGPRLHAARDEFGGRYRRLGEISGRLERSPWRSTWAWLASGATRALMPDTWTRCTPIEGIIAAGSRPADGGNREAERILCDDDVIAQRCVLNNHHVLQDSAAYTHPRRGGDKRRRVNDSREPIEP